MKKVTTSCPGRICLLGEYSTLVKEAILISLDDYRTRVELKPKSSGISVQSSNYDEVIVVNSTAERDRFSKGWSKYIFASISLFEKKFNTFVNNIDVIITSDLPPDSGLASSSAVTIAFLGALFEYYHKPYDEKKLANFAYLVERSYLDMTVGQMDAYGCVFGGVTYVDCSDEPIKYVQNFDYMDQVTFVIVNSKEPKKTGDIAQKVMSRVRNGDLKIDLHVRILKELILDTKKEFQSNNISPITLGKRLISAQNSLRDNLKVSTGKIDEICELVINNGALGAKLTGAGGGGCVISLCLKEDCARLTQSLSEQNHEFYLLNSSTNGYITEIIHE